MAAVDVDAILDAGATQTGDATVSYAVDSALSGAGTVTAPQLTDEIASSMSGAATQTGDAGVVFAASSALSGDSAVTSNLDALLALLSSLSGDASLASDLAASFALQAAFAGDTALVSDLTGSFLFDATLAGSSDMSVTTSILLSATLVASGSAFTISDLTLVEGLVAALQSAGTFLQADLTWKPHPGAPPPKPSINAAATLQQFIDATGSGRSSTKTLPANNAVVDPNPPRKPFKPR